MDSRRHRGNMFGSTYHHNRIEAYSAIAVAILDAGLNCSASIPCPAEMGGSIHIHGTGSSIVDTIFVCRKHGTVRRSMLFDSVEQLAEILDEELSALEAAGMNLSDGDVRCIVFGHLARMAIWRLRGGWDENMPTAHKLLLVRGEMDRLGTLETVRRLLGKRNERREIVNTSVCEERAAYGLDDAVAF